MDDTVDTTLEPERLLRVAAEPARADEWALVLASADIAHRIVALRDGWGVTVAAADGGAAVRVLAAYDRESAADADAPPAIEWGASGAAIAVVVVLAAFHYVAAGSGVWLRAGAASVDGIRHGELWRTVTALTLHADLGHIAGNAVASLLFIGALARWIGPGAALALALLAGAGANVAGAYWHDPGHVTIGASGATFGALGGLAGLGFVHRLRGGAFSRRRAWTSVGAALALFGLLGTSAHADVLAHVAGLAIGTLLGGAIGALVRRPLRPLPQAALVLAVAGTVTAAWLRAFA